MSVQRLMPILHIIDTDYNYVEKVCPYCGKVLKVVDGNEEINKKMMESENSGEKRI